MAMEINWEQYQDLDLDDDTEPTDAELAAIDAEMRAVDVMAWDAREWHAAQTIRAAMADLALATIDLYDGAPF